ncbi:hypothetical protein VroAM7_44880 [Vibrio rotiferianus]|uniref:Uncharacterized protein n=2 Tax=Vibrio rotiferianus TaxID=190895 RepID=A0A510IDG0_9VIBR|nr:hypothetical protein VroAM7_44880 [Vibrio rotiferianus]
MWSKTSLSWPTVAEAIQARGESVNSPLTQSLSHASQRLEALSSDADYRRHSLSEDAEALLVLRQEMDELITNGKIISVTPYQFEVGERLKSGCYLSPENASQVLADKLRDLSDIYCPRGTIHVIAIMVTSHEIGDFAQQLTNLCRVFNLSDWTQCARQAKAMTTNERDKLHQPSMIMQPRFKPTGLLKANPLDSYLVQQSKQVATLESLASDKTHLIDKLGKLSSKRALELQNITVAINALKSLGGSVYSVKFTGSADSVAASLLQIEAPNKHPYTLASLLISQTPMPFFEELLCSH